jgi:hypothetical protein
MAGGISAVGKVNLLATRPNDFCVKDPGSGIQLYYEGSPGYQAYGHGATGYPR